MSVIIQMWKRLAPSRTKKLSTSWVMILRLTGRGKVARCGLCFIIKVYKMPRIDNQSLNAFFGENKDFGDFLEYIYQQHPDLFIKDKGKIVSISLEIDINPAYSPNFKDLSFDITFDGIVFKEKVSFCNCEFMGKVSFKNCIFKKGAYFNNTTFGNYIDFHECEFEKNICLYGVKFQKVPNFSACYFKEPKAANLINVDINNLDFKKIEQFIDENYQDKAYINDIEQNLNEQNEKDKKLKEIEQKYRLRYAQNAKDSFRAIKDILIGQNNTLEAQKWHKLELYAKEKEIEINLERNHKSSSNQEINIVQSSEVNSLTLVIDNILLWLYRNSSLHHTSFTRILNFSVCNIVLYFFYSVFLDIKFMESMGFIIWKI